MPNNPWTTRRFECSHLRIPTHSQPEGEQYCTPYALWMVVQYIKNEYPDGDVRSSTRSVSVDEITEFLEPDPLLGWKPNQSDLTEVSTYVSAISFSLEQWRRNPPQSLLELAEERLESDLPIIGVIDAQMLRRGIRGDGPLHSVVIAGVGDDNAIIADPWYAALHEVPRDKLKDAWDPSHHQIIDVAVGETTSSAGGNQ